MSFVEPSVVLLSGGLDSAVLLAHEAAHARVWPVYVQVGLAWEHAELQMVDRLLEALPMAGQVEPLALLEIGMRDLYPATHWAVRGEAPAYDTPDDDVYLVGRNLVLLTKAALFAASRPASRIAIGTLANNPFPDATPAFFDAAARALTIGLDRPLAISRPFAEMRKDEVIRLGERLGVPLQYSLSCMSPHEDRPLPVHCGCCSKCRERREAFVAAGVTDPTPYAFARPA